MIRTALATLTVAAAVMVAGPSAAVAAPLLDGCMDGVYCPPPPPPCNVEGCVKPPKPCVDGLPCGVDGGSGRPTQKHHRAHVRFVRR